MTSTDLCCPPACDLLSPSHIVTRASARYDLCHLQMSLARTELLCWSLMVSARPTAVTSAVPNLC